MLCVALVICISEFRASNTWSDTLSRLSAFPHEYASVAKADSGKALGAEWFQAGKKQAALVAKWFQRAGTLGDFNDATNKGIGGIQLACPDSGIARVVGMRRATIMLLESSRTPGRDFPIGYCLALFQQRGAKIDSQILETGEGPWECALPVYAAAVGNRIFISGERYWAGNGPSAVVNIYQRSKNSWKKSKSVEAEFESWVPPRLVLSRDKKRVVPVQVNSRTYPTNLDCCHATANLAYAERWSFASVKPAIVWKRKRNTAFNALDSLYGNLKRGDRRGVRFYSASKRIANRILALRPRITTGGASVSYPDSLSSNEGTVIGLENLRTTFHFGVRHGRWVVVRLASIEECDGRWAHKLE